MSLRETEPSGSGPSFILRWGGLAHLNTAGSLKVDSFKWFLKCICKSRVRMLGTKFKSPKQKMSFLNGKKCIITFFGWEVLTLLYS